MKGAFKLGEVVKSSTAPVEKILKAQDDIKAFEKTGDFIKSSPFSVIGVELATSMVVEWMKASQAGTIMKIREPLYLAFVAGVVSELSTRNKKYTHPENLFYYIAKGFIQSINKSDKEALIFTLAEIYRRNQPQPGGIGMGSALEIKWRYKIINKEHAYYSEFLYRAFHSILIRTNWTVDDYDFSNWDDNWDYYFKKHFVSIEKIIAGLYKDDPHS